MRYRSIFALGVLLCAPCQAEESPLEAAQRTIRDADIEFCQATIDRDKARFLSFIADEAVFFGPGPTVGREAIGEDWAPFFAENGPSLTWEPNHAVVFESGDLGYTTGTYQLVQPDAQGRLVTSRGNYLSVWRKQADGSWKVVSDIGTRPQPAR